MKTTSKYQTLASRSVLAIIMIFSLSFLSSCGGNGTNPIIKGVQGPNVDILEDTVVVSAVFQKVNLGAGGRFSIPKYPNSYIELAPDLFSTGTVMNISISMKDIVGGNADFLDPQFLPDGRAIPGIVGGRLPAVAFTVPSFHNITFYLGKRVFGFFVPTPIPYAENIPNGIATFRFFSKGTRTGNISVVSATQGGSGSGVLLLLDLGAKVKKILNKQIKKVEKKRAKKAKKLAKRLAKQLS